MSSTNDKSRRGEPAGPNVFVIFGATGDLTRRKLLPAVYNLRNSGLIADEFAMVGISRRPISDDDVRTKFKEGLQEFATGEIDPAINDFLIERTYGHGGDQRDPETYKGLAEKLAAIDKKHGTGANYLFYLATPPSMFAPIVKQLGEAGLTQQDGDRWRRFVIEKPFGHDLESARTLNRDLQAVLDEEQIYRIDHYLGKETVQNILLLRFANGIFEPIWNHKYIDHIQITVGETVGIGSRAGYYEEAGALRDMVQNHLMQLVALTAMEPPASFDAEAVRDEKGKVLRSIQRIEPEEVLHQTIRGQYGPADGMEGYRQEDGVADQSHTESFVALKLFVDNWRWAGVPFYLRTGKRLPARVTEIAIQFRRAPHMMFRGTHVGEVPPNELVLHLQPNEGISLGFQAKIPGPVMKMGAVNMAFNYGDHFGSWPSTGYETLIYDCMCGDATLFQRADNVEAGWKVVTPMLDVWRALPPRDFPNYRAGSWGPEEADELLSKDGRRWRTPQ